MSHEQMAQEQPAEWWDDLELKPDQIRAIKLRMKSQKWSAIARQIECNPSTLYRWRKGDADFIAGLNRAKEQLYRRIAHLLDLLAVNSVAAVLHDVVHGDAQLGFRVLKASGVFERHASEVGPTDPSEVEASLSPKRPTARESGAFDASQTPEESRKKLRELFSAIEKELEERREQGEVADQLDDLLEDENGDPEVLPPPEERDAEAETD